MLTIILFQPDIPQNTGNVVRTAAVTGSKLILVRPLGFSVSSRHLKRAGLDYWEGVDIQFIDNLEEYLAATPHPFSFFSSKATKLYHEQEYSPDHILIFGSETTGLPPIYHEKWPESFVKIPMVSGQRCLNLATSVGIGTYRALYK